MNAIKILLLNCCIITLITACLRPPDFPIEPEIEFISFSKSTLVQGFFNDTTVVVFSFTDGDGDLGSDTVQNVFIEDNRTGFEVEFTIPTIPSQGNNNGISGEISIEIYSDCCILPDNPFPCQPSTTFPTDTLTYDIYIIDQAGNQSNTITTSPLVLLCQ